MEYINKNEKISKKQFLRLLDDIDKRKNDELKNDISNELQKDFESINWSRVTDCMQAIIAMRSED